MGGEWRENDGFVTVKGEEVPVLKHDVHGGEVVEVAVGMGGLELGKSGEGVDGHGGHDGLQQLS